MNTPSITDTTPNPKSSRLVRYLKVGALVGVVTAIIVYIVGLLPILAFFGAFLAQEDPSDYTPRNMVETEEAYQINLFDHYFSIPKAYVQRYGTRKGGIVVSIGFHALWPDWQVYTPEMGSKEDFLKHPHRISVSLDLRIMAQKEAYERWYSSVYGIGKESSMRNYNAPPRSSVMLHV